MIYWQKQKPIHHDLIKAGLIHIALVFLLYALTKLLNIQLPRSIQEIEEIQSAVRIDVVAMPKLTIKELEKLKVAPPVNTVEEKKEEKPEPKETSKVEFEKKTKKIDVNNLLKNFSQKKVIKKKVIKNKKFQNADLRKLVLEGNKLNAGTSTTGDSVDRAQEAFVSYIQQLPAHVRPQWKLPSYLLEKDLRCRIQVFIAANGSLIKANIFESSGVEEFDKKALDAVKNSAPYPPAEKDILSKVVSGSVILGFPL